MYIHLIQSLLCTGPRSIRSKMVKAKKLGSSQCWSSAIWGCRSPPSPPSCSAWSSPSYPGSPPTPLTLTSLRWPMPCSSAVSGDRSRHSLYDFLGWYYLHSHHKYHWHSHLWSQVGESPVLWRDSKLMVTSTEILAAFCEGNLPPRFVHLLNP